MPPAEAPTGFADKGDFRFENSLADSGPAGVVLSLGGGGSVAYADNTTFAPVASISESGFPARALSAKTFTSASFSSLLGNGVPSLFWTQTLTTPIAGSFSSRTAASTTFTASLAGTYTIRLTATDAAGASSSTTVTTGVVATDSKGIVITGLTAARDLILGPQLISGLSPWLYFDYAAKAVTKELKDIVIASPPSLAISTGTLLAGTCQLTSSPSTCIGTGTNYSSVLSVGSRVMIAWTSVDGADTGRLFGTVCTAGCPVSPGTLDATHFTISTFTNQATLGSGYKVYLLGPDISQSINGSSALIWSPSLWQPAQGAYIAYYDAPLAIRRVKYSTGLDEYLTDSNTFIDDGWQYTIDHGRYGAVPRNVNGESQFLGALDHTERFPDLYTLTQYLNAGSGAYSSSASSLAFIPSIDPREVSYVTGLQALGAITDPDSTRHTNYCLQLDTSVGFWITYQDARGFWPERVQGYTYAPPYGTSPWRMAIYVHNLQLSYEALKDYCANPTRAASLLTTITKAVDFLYLYGRKVTRDGYYDVIYPNDGQALTPGAGTVSASLTTNPTTIVGSGTSFVSVYPVNNKYIGIPDGTGSRFSYLVTAVADDTHLTIASPWGSQGEVASVSGVEHIPSNLSSTSCSPSLAAYCNGPDRNFVVQLAGVHGWMYSHTNDQTYKTRGDEVFSASFGGPADGPGGSAAPGGPNADGTITFVTEGMFNCANIASATSGFCSSNGSAIGPHAQNGPKNLGEGLGVLNAQRHLADRLGGLAAADLRTLVVEGNLASVANATKLRVTITYPDGTATTTTCAAARCAVIADARQAGAVQKVDFLSSSNAVLATGESVTLTAASFQ